MTEAVQLADQLTEEIEEVRRQLGDHQALLAAHEALEMHLAEMERHHAEELTRSHDKSARQPRPRPRRWPRRRQRSSGLHVPRIGSTPSTISWPR